MRGVDIKVFINPTLHTVSSRNFLHKSEVMCELYSVGFFYELDGCCIPFFPMKRRGEGMFL